MWLTCKNHFSTVVEASFDSRCYVILGRAIERDSCSAWPESDPRCSSMPPSPSPTSVAAVPAPIPVYTAGVPSAPFAAALITEWAVAAIWVDGAEQRTIGKNKPFFCAISNSTFPLFWELGLRCFDKMNRNSTFPRSWLAPHYFGIGLFALVSSELEFAFRAMPNTPLIVIKYLPYVTLCFIVAPSCVFLSDFCVNK